ncbi:MAG: pitrilysin family protein, partial [Acidobacteriaceae bacterium]
MRSGCVGVAAAMVAVCFGTTGVAAAQGKKAAEGKMKLPEIKYETYTLPNGLKVITHEDHRLPLVAVDLWYHVGPLNERAGRTGFAHLFEHMMFEGSEHVGQKAHIKDVEAAGATDVNGTTDFDRTNYFETMPANQLELALWLESDRMGFLMEGLNRTLLENQRDVVRNEKRQGEGSPYEVAEEAMMHALFPKGHPYYGDVMGSHADIESARLGDVRAFHQEFYTPNNASIAIAGDFDPVKLKAMLTKYFGPIPAGPKVEAVHLETPPITSQKRVKITDTVKLPRLTLAWLTPAAFTPGSYAASVAMYAMGMAKVSRLDAELVYKDKIAQSVECGVNDEKLIGWANCDITAKPGVKLADLEAAAWKVIAQLQQEGPTAEEVEAAKAGVLSGKIFGLERLGGFGGVADTLDRYNQYTGDPGYLPKDVAAEEAVTPAEAKAAAQRYFTKDAAVVVYCEPGPKVLQDVPRAAADTDANVKTPDPYSDAFEKAQDWRKTMPKAGPPLTVHLPVPVEFELANGMKVYVVEERALPVLSASVVVRAGSENNAAAMAGLASLTAQTMGEATQSMDVKQLAAAEEEIGTRVSVYAGMDTATAGMNVLTEHERKGLGLLAEVVERPAFAESDFDRLKKQRLVGIEQQGDSVSAMVFRVGPNLLFGDTPYGMPANGTTESVTAITRGDEEGFYKEHFGPKDSALVLAGDVTVPEARKLAETYFGGWTGSAEGEPKMQGEAKAETTHVVIVDKPGAPQTALFAFGEGVPEDSPELQVLQVMNYTLGGAFASRINMNLREQHGYTYGGGSAFRSYREGGEFLAGALVRTNVTGAAATQLMDELKRFPEDPPTETELTQAKDASVQSLPGEFATTFAIAGSMSNLFTYHRPLDYYATLPAKYEAVTAADVAQAAKEYVHPNHLIIVAAGDRAKIEPQLKEANLGPIEVRTIDGRLVSDQNKLRGKG